MSCCCPLVALVDINLICIIVRVCGDVVLLNVWCGFVEIFIFCGGIAVLLNQAVCGI